MEPENKISKTQSRVVNTYAEDMARVIESDREGLVKKIIHGEEQHELEKKNLSPESKKNKFFMSISFLFIVLSFIGLYFLLSRKGNPPVTIEKTFTPLIFNDKTAYFEVAGISKDDLTQTILNETNRTNVKDGGVEGFYLTENKNIIGLRRFITLIKGNFIPSSADSVSDSFLMGVVNGNTKDFFILIKDRSTPDIFNQMRSWENKMFFDLHGFFGIDISLDTNYLITKNFTDGIVENKNARMLYDNNNNIVMMYIFADDNSVIITKTLSSAQEIILRLASSQVQK